MYTLQEHVLLKDVHVDAAVLKACLSTGEWMDALLHNSSISSRGK